MVEPTLVVSTQRPGIPTRGSCRPGATVGGRCESGDERLGVGGHQAKRSAGQALGYAAMATADGRPPGTRSLTSSPRPPAKDPEKVECPNSVRHGDCVGHMVHESLNGMGCRGERARVAIEGVGAIGAQHQRPARAGCTAGQDYGASLAIWASNSSWSARPVK